jgi:hypothetical protein
MTNNLVIIDDTIVDHSVIIESLNIHTSYILLNGLTDTYDTLKIKITNLNILAFNSIGIIQHNTNEPTYCLFRNINIPQINSTIQNNDENNNSLRIININDDNSVVATEQPYTRPPVPVSILSNVYEKDPDLESWTDYINFITFLKTTYLMQNFDIMACAIYSDENWRYVIDLLKIKTGVNIRASLDNTGSSELGGNWFLETDNINLKDIYFTENINKFNGLLNVITGFTGICGPQYWSSGGGGIGFYGDGNGDGWTTAYELTLRSPNRWREDGGIINNSRVTQYGLGTYTITWLPGWPEEYRVAGTISCYYSATTEDTWGWDWNGVRFDPFGYIFNGQKYPLVNWGATGHVYGWLVIYVEKSDTFGFYTQSSDQVAGSSEATINNFTFTPTIIMETPTLVTSQSTIYQKFVSGAIVSFDFISSSAAGIVSRTYESNDPLIITIPTASTPSASIVAPGKTTIKVTQHQTTNYTEVIKNDLIAIVIIGQGQTYTSETFSSIDLSGANLSGSTFSNCTLTDTNLFGTTVSPTTNFTSSTLKGIMSGRIIGTTDLLPPGFKMI